MSDNNEVMRARELVIAAIRDNRINGGVTSGFVYLGFENTRQAGIEADKALLDAVTKAIGPFDGFRMAGMGSPHNCFNFTDDKDSKLNILALSADVPALREFFGKLVPGSLRKAMGRQAA